MNFHCNKRCPPSKMSPRILLSSIWPALAASAILIPRQDSSNTATVDLSAIRGSPKNLASGFIYGIPDSGFGQSPDQIPDAFYQDMGFNYARAGGAQMSEGGWVVSEDAYSARFQSTKDNYQVTRRFEGRFQILPHDLWGTDHADNSSYWPGDDGDWTNYDKFLDQLLGDLKDQDMLAGMEYDLWNEYVCCVSRVCFAEVYVLTMTDRADGSFWERDQAQYLAMWNRTYHRIRSGKISHCFHRKVNLTDSTIPLVDSALDDMLIVGPSSAGQPSSTNTWWTTWLQYVVENNVYPDQVTFHEEPGDPTRDIPNLNALLSQYGAPSKPVNINEYATFDQQNSGGAAWWISRLERYDLFGLRGNWLSTWQLHDFMASLLGKTDTSDPTGTGYYGNGEFQVYKYYHQNMTGSRATTTSSGDGTLDVYTTIGSDKVRTLTGVLDQTGTWYITIKGLSAAGLPESGSLDISTLGFEDSGHFGEEGQPSDRGSASHTYSGDAVTFPVYQTTQDEHTAWGFEFAVGS